MDQLCDWLEEPADAQEIAVMKTGLAIMYGLHDTLGRALEGSRDGR
jgi:hypothetical protein